MYAKKSGVYTDKERIVNYTRSVDAVLHLTLNNCQEM